MPQSPILFPLTLQRTVITTGILHHPDTAGEERGPQATCDGQSEGKAYTFVVLSDGESRVPSRYDTLWSILSDAVRASE